MSEQNSELLLLDFVQVVLASPRMYTIHSSFDEVVAFICGYHAGHGHSETRWFDFLESERRDNEHADQFFLSVRQRCPDDAAAIRELETLYTHFLQRNTY